MTTVDVSLTAGSPPLKLQSLTGQKFSDITFTLVAGEVLGIVGELGSGAEELAETIVGWRSPFSGRIEYGRSDRVNMSSRRLRKHGIIFLPGDRKVDGLALSRSVRENIVAPTLASCRRWGLLSKKVIRRVSERAASEALVGTNLLEVETGRLSGGQQQKVLLAQCLAANPKVLIALEPTRGVDVYSRAEIHETLRRMCREHGVAVLVVSSDTRELVEISDRILVMAAGQIVGEVSEPSLGEAHLIEAMSSGERTRGHILGHEVDTQLNGVAMAEPIASDHPVGISSPGEELGSSTSNHESQELAVVKRQPDRHERKFSIGANHRGLWKERRQTLSRSLLGAPWVPGILGVLLLGTTLSFTSRFFFTTVNAGDLGRQVVVLALASLGEMLVILVAGIDLSIGAVVTLTNLVSTVLLMRESSTIAVSLSLAIGLLSGALCGSLVLTGLPSFLVTFAVGLIEGGLALLWFPNSVGPAPRSFWKLASARLGPVPTATIALALLFIAVFVILRFTKPGRHLVASGRDPIAARRNGLHVRSLIFSAYCGSGILAAAAGIFLTARVGGGLPGSGNDIPLDAIAAVMLGGASFFGGRVSVLGTLAGVIVLTLVGNGLDLLHVNAFFNDVVLGVVLLLVVGGASLARRPRRGARLV